MLISEFSKRSGVSVHTLRYYEKEGLLKSIQRDAGGRRRYQTSDLEWIVWIKRLKSTGMPIASIKQFANLRLEGDASLAARKAILATHAEHLKAEIARLNSELSVVEYKVDFYAQTILDLE